jgi:hypothetical protein
MIIIASTVLKLLLPRQEMKTSGLSQASIAEWPKGQPFAKRAICSQLKSEQDPLGLWRWDFWKGWSYRILRRIS